MKFHSKFGVKKERSPHGETRFGTTRNFQNDRGLIWIKKEHKTFSVLQPLWCTCSSLQAYSRREIKRNGELDICWTRNKLNKWWNGFLAEKRWNGKCLQQQTPDYTLCLKTMSWSIRSLLIYSQMLLEAVCIHSVHTLLIKNSRFASAWFMQIG